MNPIMRISSIALLAFLAMLGALSSCQPLPDSCCDCVYEHDCVSRDSGSCSMSDDPCYIEHDEDDDNDLLTVFCYLFHDPDITIFYSCAHKHGCLKVCPEDDPQIIWD